MWVSRHFTVGSQYNGSFHKIQIWSLRIGANKKPEISFSIKSAIGSAILQIFFIYFFNFVWSLRTNNSTAFIWMISPKKCFLTLFYARRKLSSLRIYKLPASFTYANVTQNRRKNMPLFISSPFAIAVILITIPILIVTISDHWCKKYK